MKLLLIEDHAEISKVIFEYFELKGHEMDYASDGKHGIELATTNHYDMIILDIMLPQIDGLSVCRQLRQQGNNTPVIMLTACDEKEDILSGFEQGADDYLVKPFDLNILEARINAIYQRFAGKRAVNELSFNDLVLDLTNHQALRGECHFTLNNAQFKLLKLLMLKSPGIATREEISRELWQDDEPDEDLIRNHVYRLRTLIDKPFKKGYIKTIPKVGYQLSIG
ncbi:response regulator transcription factor [Psychrobium sp. MM17-31]|uniref:response regulator transcription factor n=1 Tax=Psychrobium sp. MM17-31 TaxID=2917758 RepID=UPI001EF483FB|nr:response regulator transcription factor [Psychrobium sp. MM17-31]MCG7531041.1 response regulator transcription factor [Psychrobium sp. MM17-31]